MMINGRHKSAEKDFTYFQFTLIIKLHHNLRVLGTEEQQFKNNKLRSNIKH